MKEDGVQLSDEHWMSEALKLAELAAEAGEVPVGALVVLDGEVVGRGWNHPISGHDPTAHAEIKALRDAAQKIQNYRLVNAEIYVTIEPCTMCAGAIVHARIKRLIFGAGEPKSGVICSNGYLLDQPWMNHRVKYSGGVLAEKCSARISQFFQQRRLEIKEAKRRSKK